MSGRLLIVLSYAFVGLLLAGLSIPLILRRVPPNHFYGFRVPKTINNPDIWYEINAYAGQRLLVAGLIMAVVATGLNAFAPNLGIDLYSTILVGVTCVSLVVGIGQSFYKLSKM